MKSEPSFWAGVCAGPGSLAEPGWWRGGRAGNPHADLLTPACGFSPRPPRHPRLRRGQVPSIREIRVSFQPSCTVVSILCNAGRSHRRLRCEPVVSVPSALPVKTDTLDHECLAESFMPGNGGLRRERPIAWSVRSSGASSGLMASITRCPDNISRIGPIAWWRRVTTSTRTRHALTTRSTASG